MAFNFPASPTPGQRYEPSPGLAYYWTGQAWDREGQTSIPSKMLAGVISPFAGITPPPGALWCDGSTFNELTYPKLYAALGNINTTPDLRGRTITGRDDMGGTAANRVTNAGVGNPGIDAKTLFASGGFDRMTLAAVQMPAHYHSGSGTSSTISADHAHNFNVNSGLENANHRHYVSGSADAVGNHSHDYSRYTATNNVAAGSTSGLYWQNVTTGVNTSSAGTHGHTMNFWSGYVEANHLHNVAGGTAGVTANHTHTYSFDSDWKGGGEAHPIMMPTMVLNWIIWTGE